MISEVIGEICMLTYLQKLSSWNRIVCCSNFHLYSLMSWYIRFSYISGVLYSKTESLVSTAIVTYLKIQQSGAKSHVKGSLWGHHSSIVVRLSSLLYHSWPTRGTNEKNQSHTFGEAIHQRQQDPANTFTYWDVPHIVRTCAALTIAAPWTPGLNSTYLAFFVRIHQKGKNVPTFKESKTK